MSSTLSSSSLERTGALPKANVAPPWLREPLLHFLLLGGLLFVADHYLVTRADDPHTIIVGAAVDAEARQVFKDARGREPDAKELAALRRVWLDNEVLYREGLALQVDKGDTAIRERVIFKALSVVDANTKLPPVNDKVLREWFEAHRASYDEPARYDFQEAVPAGENSESRVRALVGALNSGTSGDAEAGLRVFKGRPKSNLDQSYGPDFAKELEQAGSNEWHAIKTQGGWHAVRLTAVTPPKPATFEVVRPLVLQAWTDATMAEQRSAAVANLAKKYKIKFEEASK